jgi:hypothetical protein
LEFGKEGDILMRIATRLAIFFNFRIFEISNDVFQQLINPTNVLELERSTIAADKAQIEEQVEKELRQTYSNYQKQHTDYERHILAQIAVLQNQIVKIQGIIYVY